ncbi:hypothetical protein A3860_39730 [Niastella vici]|uniref:Uncharacterized protein n=1 Tax=Niastella vici TaxID=1703345 RepID=A0A1V9FHS7_9BACT|nr:hypothetical protein [Niastella vici]OQP57929.1 hypothetical protein A3860_39730 [Niastella vici]
MDRASYFEEIYSVTSPLLLLADQLDAVIKARTRHLREPFDIYLDFADQLLQLDNAAAKTRASFIKMQCGGIDTEDFFEQHRESWGIPKFEEDLVPVNDFKNGFLFTFRDHSTSWGEDAEARDWFFKSVEARFVRHYQFWACDNGPEEILLKASGDYKSIMWTIVNDYQVYSALTSPIFTKDDLQEFYNNFDEAKGNYYKKDLLEMIEENPNW